MILMSNNIWKCDKNEPAWEANGDDCSADVRVEGLFRAYSSVVPDIIGLQESSYYMLSLLMPKMCTLAKYEVIFGGDTPIVYRSDKFKVLETGFIRYPEHLDGYDGNYNNGGTKSYCYGVFREKATGDVIAFMSTHLWYMKEHKLAGSALARVDQITRAYTKLNEVIERYNCPGFIVGDFNANIESKCYAAISADGWQEVYDVVKGERDETCGHHFCYDVGWRHKEEGTSFKEAIDHMMVKNLGGFELRNMLRIDDEYFDTVSDHYPVYVELNKL